MKKIILGLAAVAALGMTSCNDFLNDNRYPLDQQVANVEFWSNTVNVQAELDAFYNYFQGYGNGSGLGWFYAKSLSDDQSYTDGFQDWEFTTAPSSSAYWNDPYTYIRRANLLIEGVTAGSITGSEETNFVAQARLMRAYSYYLLVRYYGDVPLIKQALDPADTEALYGPRTNRDEVMDYVLEDLKFAVSGISNGKSKIVFTADMAAAMMSEICLYEGTFCKYRTAEENGKPADNARAQKFLTEAANAAQPLLAKYPIGNDLASYEALYNSFRTTLNGNSEVIFAKMYDINTLKHSTIDYTSSSTPIRGITKDAFDNFLFVDGLPLAKTAEDKSDLAEVDADGNYSIAKPLAVRDGRLSVITDPYIYYTGKQYQRSNSMPMTSTTGYGVRKYWTANMSYDDAVTANRNYTCAPLYWGALVALNYAEAKAELGTLNDGDLNETLNKLYKRAGLPTQTVASLSAINDPANNMGVSSLIWEVRRCRRCELIMDNWIRYWDLIRWHQLDKLDNGKYPNILLGANITGMAVQISNVGGYIDAAFGHTRTYNKKYYLFPIPEKQMQLNVNLTQNPGW
ncbi:MAG: RagB/SusD family nutrient uptake outer membrane protein [Muribaculaceae bacterium]|nr:RagB/SusD family nutrient uptake outer membrane protein [Muribaculaceae bacterium]